MKISYLENKKLDEYPIVGNISYPTLLMEADRVDFGHVETGSVVHKTFNLSNMSDRVVDHEWSMNQVEARCNMNCKSNSGQSLAI